LLGHVLTMDNSNSSSGNTLGTRGYTRQEAKPPHSTFGGHVTSSVT